MRNFKLPSLLLLSLSLSAGCAAEDAWWQGDGEPSCDKCDADDLPLTILLSREQTNVRKILSSEALGSLSRSRTGTLNLDGHALSEDTMLVFRGTLNRFDGAVEEHFFSIQPRFISHEAGAANPSGFLKVDFKSELVRSFASGVDPLGTHAGIFRGELVASNDISLEDVLDDELTDLFIRPSSAFQRPPNYIKNAKIIFTPNVAIDQLVPSDVNCFGEDIVDTTLSHTDIDLSVLVDGFPAGQAVDVEVRYLVPETAAAGTLEHLSDFFTGLNGNEIDELSQVETIRDPAQGGAVSFPTYTTKESAWGDDFYSFEIEVSATAGGGSIFSESYIHRVTVVDEGKEAIVDAVELCPVDDVACHELRDATAAENVIARRNVIEFKAQSQGLYNTITRPIGSCSGGDAVDGDFSSTCVAYRESTDSQIDVAVATELEFELNVNGEAQGEKSWGGTIPNLGTAKVEGAFSASFKLDVDFKASFATSRTWTDRSSLDVIYDPSNTQLQWWRVVTPRIRYLEFSEFNTCGNRISQNEVFLTDLRDSRLVLACEDVPSFDTVCHAVEPTEASVGACNTLLIDPASPEGQQCSLD